ncbi:hypothetical protein G7K_1419-t1 [Saitoella complicata NRRL Y-17804]|uniref:Uncharacterized protein n=1 Tax=Saitoella complicata (strain BCRC 22490 / CBS 7301 / JCM 7358 / NBRC 10748 / NRRL Y-17804) TaxID=698492 RepID=A0A0E9NBJ3_SAICN|nr:hypothetical protein G7K_1419-t1 [Saitoella complicata NRRL Y-17804]
MRKKRTEGLRGRVGASNSSPTLESPQYIKANIGSPSCRRKDSKQLTGEQRARASAFPSSRTASQNKLKPKKISQENPLLMTVPNTRFV